MAKFVIAGRSDCPYYARVELLGDNLAGNLNSFNLHKIVKKPNEWDDWLKKICIENDWSHTKSPIVWRELIDRGGKGILIGGANDFQEYANIYYGYKSKHNSEDVRTIAKENEKTKLELDEESRYFRSLSKPLHICLTNGAGGVNYNLITSIAKGGIFGKTTELSIHLLYSNENDSSLMDGVRMEIIDLAGELVRDVTVTSDVYEAFCDCQVLVILDEVSMNENDSKQSYYDKNAALFKRYALAANQVAQKNCKVIICGSGPLNFNASIFARNCKNLSPQNIVGVSRFIENECKGILSDYLKVNSVCIADVIVWGNINNPEGRHVDLSKIRVHEYDGAIWGPPSFSLPLLEIIYDHKWVESFVDLLKDRQGRITSQIMHGLFMSQAAAISTMMSDWWNGCEQTMSSMIVTSQGWYGVPKGLMFSFPVRLHSEGYWCVVEDIDIDDTTKEKITLCVKDLQNELLMHDDPEAYENIRKLKEKVSETDNNQTKLGVVFAENQTVPETAEGGPSYHENISRPSSLERIEEDQHAEDQRGQYSDVMIQEAPSLSSPAEPEQSPDTET